MSPAQCGVFCVGGGRLWKTCRPLLYSIIKFMLSTTELISSSAAFPMPTFYDEFDFPPKTSMPYSSGQRMSSSSFFWYMPKRILETSCGNKLLYYKREHCALDFVRLRSRTCIRFSVKINLHSWVVAAPSKILRLAFRADCVKRLSEKSALHSFGLHAISALFAIRLLLKIFWQR